jgi:transposase InsO family protein
MAGEQMSKALLRYQKRYLSLDRKGRSLVLDEFCLATGYHRKYAIALLRKPVGATEGQAQRRRGVSYPESAIRVLERIWEAAGYPWSVRLKAMLPLWLPQARKRVRGCTAEVEAQLLRMSARQMDRRLAEKKRKLKRRIYGHTKPGSLLKHHIPIKTDHWDVTAPGYCEIDLVSHSGPCAAGEFIYSLNVTDIHTGWSETRAILGKSEGRVVEALEDIRRSLPFALKAIDSDNGSEFINYHLAGYCDEHNIQFTRGRPYKKNDNAHIEQKNWTHVRRIFGWDRYDTTAQLEAMNRLYRGDLSTMMNFFQPCVKLSSKARIGSKLKRLYDQAATPLDRLCQAGEDNPAAHLYLKRRETVDPFELSKCIEKQLQQLTILQGHPKKPAA